MAEEMEKVHDLMYPQAIACNGPGGLLTRSGDSHRSARTLAKLTRTLFTKFHRRQDRARSARQHHILLFAGPRSASQPRSLRSPGPSLCIKLHPR
jgi:hypothetical protein